MYDINLFSGNQRWNPNEGNVPQGYSFGTQAIDAMSNSSITVREMLYDEMTREKTLAEQQNIRDFLVANIKARESEQLGGWSRFASGWENASLQEDIAMAANEIRSIKAKGGDQELEQELQDRIARYKWRQSQITTPQDTGMWSAYNIGMVGRSMVSGFALEALFGAGELMLGAALAPVTGAGSITAATILAGRRYLRARKIAKGAYAAGKALGMWESFSRREEGSMYSDIMDRNDLTEDQKQAMAVTYGRLSGAVELLGWNLGAGGLAVKGAKAISKKIASPVDKWAADAAFKNTIKNQMKEEASKTFGAKLMTGIKGTARVTASTAAEVAEEGTQKALETTVVQQGLAGKTPTVTSALAGGFEKLAGVPVELVQGKLSEESIAILEAMGAALLPSVLVGGGGYVLSSAASYGAEVLSADTGRISGFTMKNNALKSAILSAEKNVARLTAISNFMGDASETSDVKLQLIDGMVKNAELEGAVHFAPEDTEVLLALGESKPTLKNTMARLGITKAIKEGQKTGTVSIPMQAFAELVSQPEVREGEVGKQLNVSGTVSLEDSSYSRIQRNVIAGQKKGKELLAKPSAKLEQKLNGLRRRFKAAGYADEEIEANLATFTSALATLAEASNGAVTTDELIDDFKFNIEKRDFDINSKDIESTVKKILADDREVLGYFRRVREKDRKPLPKDVAKLNIESVAAEMARIDANEKEYTGETIKINGTERSVYNSHGVRIAKSAKALKAFYKWFGNSKAVDEQGRPKVLYHGTPRASFLNFVGKDGKQRFFFTDDISIAETYSGSSHIVTREEAEGASAGDIDPSAGIYQVYLKIENPEEVDYNGKPWVGNEDIALNIQMEDGTLATDKDGSPILITTMEEAAEFFKSGTYGQASLVPAPGIVASTDMEAKKAKVRGHDGAILKNVLDVGDMATRPENEYPVSTVYVTFEPEQIKSTDNYGMFDPDAVEMYRSVIRTAYAGSPVDYLLPALKAIGTGEGHFAHGWGLYYALEFVTAERYRQRYQRKTGGIRVRLKDSARKKFDRTEKDIVTAFLNSSTRIKYGDKSATLVAELSRLVSELATAQKDRELIPHISASYLQEKIDGLKASISFAKDEIKKLKNDFEKNGRSRVIKETKKTLLSNTELFLKQSKSRLSDAENAKDKLLKELPVAKKEYKHISENEEKIKEDEKKRLAPIILEKPYLSAEELADTHFRIELEGAGVRVANIEYGIKKTSATISREKQNVKHFESVLKAIKNNTIFDSVEIDLFPTVGQVKQVTVKKIETFLDEQASLMFQYGNVKKKLTDMLSSEESLRGIKLILAVRGAEKFLDDIASDVVEEISEKVDGYIGGLEHNFKAWLQEITEGGTVEDVLANIRKVLTLLGGHEDDPMFKRDILAYSLLEKKVESVKEKIEQKVRSISSRSVLESISDGYITGAHLYQMMVNTFLGKRPNDDGGLYDKKTVHEAKKKASLMLHKYGISGITYKGAEDGDCIVVFDPSVLRVKESYYSRRKDVPATTPESEFDLFSEDTGIRGKKELFVAKHADITTFAHEVMHFVTRGLVEMYNDGSISEVWKREIEKLYDYFSTMPSRRGPSAMHKQGNKIVMETEASETLSGGFQQYIERGKASDSALEKLYAYIKDLAADLWAVLNRGYYKDQALSDAQILFYDKVMSAHIDVKNTEYKYGYAPLDKLPGVSDEEYEEYTIERKVSRAKSSNTLFKSQRQMVKNRKRKEWIKFYDEEFIKAINELRSEPEYMVMQFIKDNGGLNKDSFKSGTRLWGSVPQRYFSKKDDEGVTVEQLSAKFGPEISIADIAKILASMPSLDVAARRRARTEADRRFLEEFNPAADITPANAMRTILFIRSLVKESLMIKGEPLSSFPAHYGVWIKEAENYFMGLTVKNAKDLEKWANMESRVTDDFMAAFTGGNTDLAALKADQRAMVNYVMVRSKQLRKQEASFKRRFKKFYSAPKGKDIKTMDGVTWNLIHTILQEYGFTRKSGRLSASAKEQFSAWIEARKGKKYFPYETLVNEIGLLSSIPKITSLTVERFNRMVALVETIRAVGEAEKRVFDGIKREQLDVVAGQIIDNIMKIRATKGDKAFLAYGKGSLSRLTVPQMGMLEPLFGEMGMQKLYVALRNALVARDDLADNTRTFIADSFERNGIGNLLADKREFMVGNRVVTNNILLFALQHSGNDHNRDNAIKTLQQYYKDESFSEAEFEDLLNASPAGMRNYVNDLWAMFKNMKNLIDEQTRVATGELIATVEPKSYTLRDGTKMSGGYFPAKKVNKVGITDPLDTYYDNNFLYPRAGLLKDRIKNATGNLDLSQDSLSRWIFQAVNLATTQVAFNDIATIFQDEAVINALGPNASLVTQYVNDWLQAAVMPIAPQPKTLRAIAKGPTVVFLGFKAVSGLVQLLGTLVGLNEVSMPSLLASSGKLLNVGKYFKISEEMGKRSAFMADRARKFDSRFFGLMKDENMLQKATRKYGDGLVTASMSFVRTFQCMADMVVWDGAFADAKKNGMSDKDASDHADYVVMKTQGDRVQMNTPEGFQGILRFFQPFMTYILTLSQMGNAALRSKNFKKFGTLVALIVLSNALEAYFKENDKEWRRKLLGKKTKGTDRDFWQRYRNRFLVQTVSTLGDVALPFAGLGGTLSLTLTEDMLKSVSPGYRAYSAGATPAVEVVTKAAKAITLDEKTWKSIYDWDMSLGANLVDFVL